MCDLVASPELCILMRNSPDQLLDRYELSPRDRRRLVDMVQQRGMAVNCALYRANRIAPLYNLMPHTCFLLGDALMDEAIEFWKYFEDTRLQFKEEVEKFGDFLRERIGLGLRQSPFLAEALEYELALNDFRFIPRLEVLSRLQRSEAATDRSNRIRLHPLIRVLLFRHEPERLLQLLNERQRPPYELDAGEFWLLLDGKGEELEAKRIGSDLGRLLGAIEAGTEVSLSADDVEMLIEAGLTVRAA